MVHDGKENQQNFKNGGESKMMVRFSAWLTKRNINISIRYVGKRNKNRRGFVSDMFYLR